MMDKNGEPRPAFYAKKLCTQYVQYGDWISFPIWKRKNTPVDAVVAHSDDGRLSALLVHLEEKVANYAVSELNERLKDCDMLFKIDDGTGNRVVQTICDGTV